ncbi:MAG: (d)CMP kinase [Sphingomonadaceae bacterium]
MKAPVICIDGPAASGKTTIARVLADELGFFYLDTGVLYRAVTWVAIERGIAPDDGEGLAKLAEEMTIEVKPAPSGDPRQTVVLADGDDVSLAIRSPQVDANVSEVSAHPEVRLALIDVQRSVADKGGVILAGRDTGTVVWPEAEVKIFLVASDEERARRRQRQAEEQGTHLDFDTVLAELRRRDAYDSGRAVAPLKPAEDAVTVDTTDLTIEQVVEKVLDVVQRRTGTKVDPSRQV